MIAAHGLAKHYGTTVAVDNLSFKVTPGVVTGFLGPNGSGKSTTMRMIMGLDNPDVGIGPGQRHAPTPNSGGRCARWGRCSTPRPSTPAAPPTTTCCRWPGPTTFPVAASTRCSTSSG